MESAQFIGDLDVAKPVGNVDVAAEGDDIFRMLKSVLKNTFTGFVGPVILTGSEAAGSTVNDFVVTTSPVVTTYANRMFVLFKTTHTNTGAATLALAGTTSKALKSAKGVNLVASEITSGDVVLAFYDGTEFRVVSQTRSGASFTNAEAAFSSPVGYRNMLVNGEMRFAQRVSAGSWYPASYKASFGLDHWCIQNDGVYPVKGFLQRVASAHQDFDYAARCGRPSGETSVLDLRLFTCIESKNIPPLAGRQVALSFYARKAVGYSAAGNILTVTLTTGTGVDEGCNKATAPSFTGGIGYANNVTLTTSFQRFSIVMTLGSADINELRIAWSYTPVGTASSADYFEITGVQLESGGFVTEFEHIPYVDDLARCQRYIYVARAGSVGHQPIAVGTITSSGDLRLEALVQFPVPMRAAPTIDTIGAGALVVQVGNTTDTITTIAPTDTVTEMPTLGITCTLANVLFSVGDAALLRFNGATMYLIFDAEI